MFAQLLWWKLCIPKTFLKSPLFVYHPIIAKHSICFIRIINTVPKKKSSSGSRLWSAKEMYAVPYLWLTLPLAWLDGERGRRDNGTDGYRLPNVECDDWSPALTFGNSCQQCRASAGVHLIYYSCRAPLHVMRARCLKRSRMLFFILLHGCVVNPQNRTQNP